MKLHGDTAGIATRGYYVAIWRYCVATRGGYTK